MEQFDPDVERKRERNRAVIETLGLACGAFVFAVFIWLALSAVAVKAQDNCSAHDDIVRELAKTYDEFPQHIGLTQRHNVLEVFLSKKGTFTIILTGFKGTSCIMVSGEGWKDLPPLPELGRPL